MRCRSNIYQLDYSSIYKCSLSNVCIFYFYESNKITLVAVVYWCCKPPLPLQRKLHVSIVGLGICSNIANSSSKKQCPILHLRNNFWFFIWKIVFDFSFEEWLGCIHMSWFRADVINDINKVCPKKKKKLVRNFEFRK